MEPLDRIIRDMTRLSGSARVGALDEENATKLSYSEFGTKTADPRPTISVVTDRLRKPIAPRPTISVVTDRLRKPIARAIDRRIGAVLDGKSRDTGAEVLAPVARDLAEEVQDQIDGNTPPVPLAASTLAQRNRRGQGDRTLVASGDMLRSINVETSPDPERWTDE